MNLFEDLIRGKKILKKWRLRVDLLDPSGAICHTEEQDNTITDGARFNLPFLLAGLVSENFSVPGTGIGATKVPADPPYGAYAAALPYWTDAPLYPTKMLFGDGAWDPDAIAFRDTTTVSQSPLFANNASTQYNGVVSNFPIVPGTVVVTTTGFPNLTDSVTQNGVLVPATGSSHIGFVNYETGEIFLRYGTAPTLQVDATYKYKNASTKQSLWCTEVTDSAGTLLTQAPYHKLPFAPIIAKGLGNDVDVKGGAPSGAQRIYIPSLAGNDNEIKFISLISGAEGNGGNPALGRVYSEAILVAGPHVEFHNGSSWEKVAVPNNLFGSGVVGNHLYAGGWDDCLRDFINGITTTIFGQISGYSVPPTTGAGAGPYTFTLPNHKGFRRSVVFVADGGSNNIGGGYQVVCDDGTGTGVVGDAVSGSITGGGAVTTMYGDGAGGYANLTLAVTFLQSATNVRAYFLDYNPGFTNPGFDLTQTPDRVFAIRPHGVITKYPGFSLKYTWTLVA